MLDKRTSFMLVLLHRKAVDEMQKRIKKVVDKLKKEWYDYKEMKEERNREKNKRDLYRKLFDNMIEKF